MWERKGNWRDRQDVQVETPPPPPRKAPAPARPAKSVATLASLGETLTIKGEISGSEDLVVNGRFEGRIVLKNHNLTIGPNGKVDAELRGKNVAIEGDVNGDVIADEKVELVGTAHLEGDIKAPRFAMSDGSQFKGNVDMGQVTTEGPFRGD